MYTENDTRVAFYVHTTKNDTRVVLTHTECKNDTRVVFHTPDTNLLYAVAPPGVFFRALTS